MPPLPANSTTAMAPAPARSADEPPTWEFKDWFDGEYLDKLIRDYLYPEGQELVDEVTRQVARLSLATNLAQEVAGLGGLPEGQELVDEVMRRIEQLSLASNSAQEVTRLGEQPKGQEVVQVTRQVEQLSLAQAVAGPGEQLALTQERIVRSEGPMVNGNGPTASGENKEPNGQRQGNDHQLPQ